MSSQHDLIESEQSFRAIFENSPIAIPIVDEKGRIMQANQRFYDLLGYEENDVKGMKFADFTHPDDIIACMKQFNALRKEEIPFIDMNKRYVRKDGSEAICHVYAVKMNGADNEPRFYAMIEDLTQKISREKDFREMEQIFYAILSNISMCVCLVDEFGCISRTMGSSMEKYGLKKRYLTKRSLRDIFPEHKAEIERALSGSKAEFLESGTSERGIPWSLQHFIFPNRAREKGSIILAIDVTELREESRKMIRERALELSRYNSEIRQISKVTSAHLQEPLKHIADESRQLWEALEGSKKNREIVDRIIASTASMQSMLNGLHNYLQIQNSADVKERVNVGEILTQSLEDLRELISEKGAIVTQGKMPSLYCNSGQFAQVFKHLIANALIFSGNKKPRVHISTETSEEGVTLKVSDNGVGIDEADRATAFNMFESVRNKSGPEIHGIGLAVVKKVVENHRGKVWVESEKDKGSTFYLWIPTAS